MVTKRYLRFPEEHGPDVGCDPLDHFTWPALALPAAVAQIPEPAQAAASHVGR